MSCPPSSYVATMIYPLSPYACAMRCPLYPFPSYPFPTICRPSCYAFTRVRRLPAFVLRLHYEISGPDIGDAITRRAGIGVGQPSPLQGTSMTPLCFEPSTGTSMTPLCSEPSTGPRRCDTLDPLPGAAGGPELERARLGLRHRRHLRALFPRPPAPSRPDVILPQA
eukprot:1975545-Rhodomonas_salina.2